MVRALILFTTKSVELGRASPKELQHLLQNANAELEVSIATYDDLVFIMDTSSANIQDTKNRHHMDYYDVVYLRRIDENPSEAVSVGKFCLANGIKVFDEEIALRPGSMTKLMQYMQFSLEGTIHLPRSIYSSSTKTLLQYAATAQLKYPVIVKSISGSRGSDNHKAEALKDIEMIVAESPEIPFLVQDYVENNCDYRIWVCGDQIGPILRRNRTEGHMNNTSQGGNASLVEKNVLPAAVLDECLRASRLLNRTVAGVDVIFEDDALNNPYYILEANRSPQIEGTPYEHAKASALADFLVNYVNNP